MASKIIKTIFLLRRSTTAEWELNKDTIPAAGEPCFDLDLSTLRIGDGKTTYENLPVIGGVELASDGESIVVQDGALALAGFDMAEAGTSPRKAADGTIEWAVTDVTILQQDIANVTENITNLTEQMETTNTQVTTIQETLETKADAETVTVLQTVVEQKADVETVTELQTVVEQKVDQETVNSIQTELKEYIDEQIKTVEVTNIDDGEI